jgi:hypothetical protein
VDLARRLETLLVAGAVAALAPLLVALLPGPRIPQVVILLVGGVLIGPEVLGWADRPAIDLLANVGLGFLFLLAGYELDLHLFRERSGRLPWPADHRGAGRGRRGGRGAVPDLRHRPVPWPPGRSHGPVGRQLNLPPRIPLHPPHMMSKPRTDPSGPPTLEGMRDLEPR